MSKHWTEIPPEEAIGVVCSANSEVVGPITWDGTMCPWPWEPQSLADQPLGQYPCTYCGDMVVAGIPHPDYADLPPSPFDTVGNWGSA